MNTETTCKLIVCVKEFKYFFALFACTTAIAIYKKGKYGYVYTGIRKQWTFDMLQYIGFGLFHKKEQKSLPDV